MATESIITVYRSTTTDTPAGLTFGELAYSDLNGKFFVGKNDGTALWVGAGVTAGSVSNNSQYLIPTQSAVKSYVDGLVGGGSVVNSVNATGGSITITGDGGAITNVQSGTANTIRARLATTGVTGVASFSSDNFAVSAGGAVTIKDGGVANAELVNSSVTVSAGSGLGGGGSVSLGGTVTLTNLGVTSLNGLTGTTTITGDSAAIIGAGNSNITARLATTGVTGVAAFSSDNFAVSTGTVTIKDGGVANAELVNSTITIKDAAGDAGQAISLGQSFVIQGTTNEVTVSRSTSTLTVGLPDDVVIAGNLTVNGTVVTNNVETFIIEDPLIVLGTGNAADSVDLGFYGKYTSGGVKYTGLFRDAGDSGKYKLFTSLQEEPTTTVNVSGTGYAVATLVARIDGGTF